jgi:sorting nexin-41/42
MSYFIRTTLNGYRIESKHRYSEFESLRKLLVHQYPSIVVPPIPDKHSVVAYASKPGKAMQDPKIVMKRKRLLQSFLNRVASHAVLRGFHPFHIFLMGDTPWSEIVSATPALKKKASVLSIESRSLRKPGTFLITRSTFPSRSRLYCTIWKPDFLYSKDSQKNGFVVWRYKRYLRRIRCII